MATSMQGMGVWAEIAGETLVGHLFRFVKMASAGFMKAGSGEQVFGVVTEEAAADFPATAQYSDVGKVELGATLAKGARVMSGSDGRAVAVVTSPPGKYEAGILLGGGVAGNIVPILLRGGAAA